MFKFCQTLEGGVFTFGYTLDGWGCSKLVKHWRATVFKFGHIWANVFEFGHIWEGGGIQIWPHIVSMGVFKIGHTLEGLGCSYLAKHWRVRVFKGG